MSVGPRARLAVEGQHGAAPRKQRVGDGGGRPARARARHRRHARGRQQSLKCVARWHRCRAVLRPGGQRAVAAEDLKANQGVRQRRDYRVAAARGAHQHVGASGEAAGSRRRRRATRGSGGVAAREAPSVRRAAPRRLQLEVARCRHRRPGVHAGAGGVSGARGAAGERAGRGPVQNEAGIWQRRHNVPVGRRHPSRRRATAIGRPRARHPPRAGKGALEREQAQRGRRGRQPQLQRREGGDEARRFCAGRAGRAQPPRGGGDARVEALLKHQRARAVSACGGVRSKRRGEGKARMRRSRPRQRHARKGTHAVGAGGCVAAAGAHQ